MRPMSVDHKPNREDEERRIVQLGGKVIHWGRWRVQGVLAVSRSVVLSLDVSVCLFVNMCGRRERDVDDHNHLQTCSEVP